MVARRGVLPEPDAQGVPNAWERKDPGFVRRVTLRWCLRRTRLDRGMWHDTCMVMDVGCQGDEQQGRLRQYLQEFGSGVRHSRVRLVSA